MAIEVQAGKGAKVVLDWWRSSGGNEYLTARMFTGKDDKWYPHKTNGVFFSAEVWEEILPKIREMIHYKMNPGEVYVEEDRVDEGRNSIDDF